MSLLLMLSVVVIVLVTVYMKYLPICHQTPVSWLY